MITYWHFLFLLVILSSCGRASSVLELFPEFIDLQRKVAELNKGIGFHVKLSGGSSRQKSGRAIKFGSITSNVGNNYKSSTGSFTAPFDGMYFLTTTITIKDSSGIFQMMKNNIIISECKTGKYEKNQMPSVTMSAVVSLRKGDSVFQLEVNKGILSWFKQSRVLDGPASFFSGFLVSRYVL